MERGSKCGSKLTLAGKVSKLEHRLITLHTPLTPYGRSTLAMLQLDSVGFRSHCHGLEHVCAYLEARGLQYTAMV